MKLSGRIFNIALPRGQQWIDIELNAPVELLLELVEKRLAKTKKKTTTMKNKIVTSVALLFLACGVSMQAQTNSPVLMDTNATIQGGFQEIIDSITTATNYAVAPYMTYAPNIVAKTKVGAGILGIYNLNNYVGTALGVDWLGQFTLVSGNITLQVPVKPFHNSSSLFFQNLVVTPFGILGIGRPLSGTSSGVSEITDLGGAVRFGHFLGGTFGVGGTWGKWINAGDYSGKRYHAFLDWSHGF